MKNGTRKALVALSCLAIVAGAAMFVLGQGGVERNPSPTYQRAITDLDEEGQDRVIDWGSLPDSVIAWVYVPGTTIDYPVVRGFDEDPGFYLFHDAEGRYSAWGTPYVANGCEEGLESPLVMVYGHHMSDGTMFAPLAGYSSRPFAEEHAEIILYTPDRTLHLEPALVNVINANKKNVRLSFGDQEELEEYMAAEEAESEVVLDEYRSGRQVFAFVTCSYETSNSRTVVYAMEVKS